MLIALCWLPFVAFLAPASVTPPSPSTLLARSVADTETVPDTVADPAPVLLTANVLASYVAVKKALNMYWAEYPQQRMDVMGTHKHGHRLGPNSGLRPRIYEIDYAFWAQQYTVVKAIFTKYQVDPSQLEPTELTVYRSIFTALQADSVDSATMAGKNIAAVRAHKQELPDEWRIMRGLNRMINGPSKKSRD